MIQAIASRTLTIVLEAYKLVGRRTLIASTCRVATSTFDTEGTAPTSSLIDGGVNAWDGTILELFVVRVDAYGVVLLT